MGQLLEEALAAGAFGFSTSRTTKHRAADGRPTPSLSAEEPELAGIACAMKRAGSGVIQVNSDFGAGEFFDLMAHDKKVRDGRIHFVLVDRLGHAISDNQVRREDLFEAYRLLGVRS